MINPKQRLRVKSSIVYTELDNREAVLLNFKTKCFYRLNEVGAKIWQLLDGKNTIGEITDAIVNEYDVDKDKAFNSVNRQIKKLIKEKMVEVAV
nr:PqqD family protein [Candidatus Omnitrophota bacterium]